MNVLIVGGGGREHALAWKIKQSPKIKKIFVAPGNAGTSTLAENIEINTSKEIIRWLKLNPVDLVVVGPDSYLAEGIVDEIEELKIPVFGPTKAAAEIEWSKVFAKEFMKEEGIPTAKYQVFTELEEAKQYLKQQGFPLVIKAGGLAMGKGVTVALNLNEANQFLFKIMSEKVFGEAGNEVIIEEYLEGKEISVHAFCDGETAIIFPPAQDHKRILEDDKGPNTGGMGTVTPVPGISEEEMEEIKNKIVIPTITALKKRGRPFKGLLFPGIMITKGGPKVIEYNARFGDPETQVYLRILQSDLLEILLACVRGDLKSQKVEWSTKSAACVVCASWGYPGDYEKGKVIYGLDRVVDEDAVIFQAGTKNAEDQIVTNGGRVLGVTAVGDNLKEALAKAYASVKQVFFEGMKYRKDIGKKLM